ncbi:phosphopantetheine-binding protein [Frankia sp. AgB32]|uniref:phosphopantetheine-binding protein n=1 Tax=Frankia sp. AgB32 TaxID=631119 RepID=UPI002010341F|nr:phosphopantetheine-binding protein [Frankia sp. AgB32]MCK9893453.1 phosphopantetheine-binding protein [Frankia sp. AgB32]
MSEKENPMVPEALLAWVVDECRKLGLRVSGGEDDFFEAGGTSLTAVKLIDRAERDFGDDSLPPDELFTESRIAEIVASIQRNSKRAGAVAD